MGRMSGAEKTRGPSLACSASLPVWLSATCLLALSSFCVCKLTLASGEDVGATNGNAIIVASTSQPSSNHVVSVVRTVLQYVVCAKGSVIRYADEKLGIGTTVKPQGPGCSKMSGLVLNNPGYLILVDEKPSYRWQHDAKVIFVPADRLSSPSVVFTNIPSVSCVSSNGIPISLRWKTLKEVVGSHL